MPIDLDSPYVPSEIASKVLGDADALVGPLRARHLAFEVIRETFRNASPVRIGLLLGYRNPREARAVVNHVKSLRWWDDYLVDELVGGLVADQYGDRSQ